MSVRLPLAFALGIAAAVLLVACGDSNKKLLPPVSADRLTRHLDEVSAALDAHDCAAAGQGVVVLRDDLQRIPNSVDRRLRRRLAEGVDRLAQRVPTDCVAQTTETTPTTTETTQTETQPPTQTETTPPTQTETQPTTTAPPPTDTTTTPPANGGTTVP